MVVAAASDRVLSRADLFRILADEGRLRVLALAAEEELSVGELAELLDESQPQVSKKASTLKDAGLLVARREGTRAYLAAAPITDAVVDAAVTEGRALALRDGSLARVASVVARREEAGRRFFEEGNTPSAGTPHADGATPAHLFAMSMLLGDNALALDVGAGSGEMLDVLAPLFHRVIAIDRSEARLAEAEARTRARGFPNVSFLSADVDDVSLMERLARMGGASCAFMVRMLHHQARPEEKLRALQRLVKPGGRVVVVDYLPHHDESMREQGDVWLGFSPQDLTTMLERAGFAQVRSTMVPQHLLAGMPADNHLPLQVVCATTPALNME